ncbi:MAG: Gfo/Idh/MocA family oxidoreductase [Candidatus Omnitrophica bacterium]|nr:Gfo/Idh/MocA family oxidoreductase [Candidatus Omnitrophota bacterium]
MSVRIGIIGCGKITERASLPNLVNYKGKAEVKALCDIDDGRAKLMASQFRLNGVDISKDWKSVVKRKDIDAIFVNTPNYLHEEVACGGAAAKKHILVEKPITISNSAAANMIKAAKKNSVLLMVEQTQRFDPVHQAAKKFIDTEKLGKINMVKGRIGHAGPEYWAGGNEGWFSDKKLSGGGALIDVGIHILDLLRWLSGKEVAEVCANIKTVEKPFPVEDNGSILMRFTDGALGHFEASWTTRPYEVMTWLYGENGKIHTSIGSEKPVIASMATVGKGKDPNSLLEDVYPEIGPGSGWGSAVHYFIDCVVKREKPFIDGEEGAKSMSVILAAYESSEKGCWVKVKY